MTDKTKAYQTDRDVACHLGICPDHKSRLQAIVLASVSTERFNGVAKHRRARVFACGCALHGKNTCKCSRSQ